MDNQHRKISGYRELNAEEIALMNEIKAKASELGALVDRMRVNSIHIPHPTTPGETPFVMPPGKHDRRWVNEAQTLLQMGFMALTRAVAQPTTF